MKCYAMIVGNLWISPQEVGSMKTLVYEAGSLDAAINIAKKGLSGDFSKVLGVVIYEQYVCDKCGSILYKLAFCDIPDEYKKYIEE